jgi:hypothetical protein
LKAGFKVALVFHEKPLANYRDFLGISTAESHLHYLTQFNGGVMLPPWAKSESLTLSVAHTVKHADIYLRNLRRYIKAVKGVEKQSELFAVGSFDTTVN